MGRPAKGALSTYPAELRTQVKALREDNQGWGPISILVELLEEYNYSPSQLPGEATVHRYLKEAGFIPEREPKGILPVSKCKAPKRVHEQWQMDAEGATRVGDLGYHSMINVKDGRSKKYCMAFPVKVKNSNTQPSTDHYKWCLRLAFEESGLPRRIQVDKDSVFIENANKSPFPSRLHLWLLALGVEMCIIDRPPPANNAMVERSHQTLYNQAIKGKQYKSWRQFFTNCNKRRMRLNEKYPSRTLGKKAPLQAFPKALHSTRQYAISGESELLNLNKIYSFLAKGKWYRKVSSTKGVTLGGQRYQLKDATPGSTATIVFHRRTQKLIFRDVNELEIARLPIKNISKEILMGMDSKQLIKMKNKLLKTKDFPLQKGKTDT